MKTCIDCGSEFKPVGRNQKYCGSRAMKLGCSYKHIDDFRDPSTGRNRPKYGQYNFIKLTSFCRICKTKESLTINHIIPRIAGGSNEISNLEILCQPCNSREYSRIRKEAWILYYKSESRNSVS